LRALEGAPTGTAELLDRDGAVSGYIQPGVSDMNKPAIVTGVLAGVVVAGGFGGAAAAGTFDHTTVKDVVHTQVVTHTVTVTPPPKIVTRTKTVIKDVPVPGPTQTVYPQAPSAQQPSAQPANTLGTYPGGSSNPCNAYAGMTAAQAEAAGAPGDCVPGGGIGGQ